MNTIEVKNLTKTFGNFTAVDSISFAVEPGEIFGFLGANGAGKTTAMRMLCGLLTPTSGAASVAGYNVFTESELVKKNIGYMSQKFSLYEDLSVVENITFYATVYGLSKQEVKERSSALLTRLAMSDHRNAMVGALPLGWKQKLSFSLSLIHNPKVVFLDEPTGGVDPITRREFWDLIYETAENGTTLVVTTHYMDEAEYCDRISLMVDGRIEAMGKPEQLKTDFEVDSMDDLFYKLARNTSTK